MGGWDNNCDVTIGEMTPQGCNKELRAVRGGSFTGNIIVSHINQDCLYRRGERGTLLKQVGGVRKGGSREAEEGAVGRVEGLWKPVKVGVTHYQSCVGWGDVPVAPGGAAEVLAGSSRGAGGGGNEWLDPGGPGSRRVGCQGHE